MVAVGLLEYDCTEFEAKPNVDVCFVDGRVSSMEIDDLAVCSSVGLVSDVFVYGIGDEWSGC